MNLTDEIDHIHQNIKNKIDAEVQACEFIEGLERKANKSLETIANSIAAQTDIHVSILCTLNSLFVPLSIKLPS